MKLEDQVCNLELSKKLKTLGVKQESAFYWVHLNSGEWILWYWKECVLHKENASKFRDSIENEEYVAAFTVAELGEMLPTKIKPIDGFHTEQFLGLDKKHKNKWEVFYQSTYLHEGGGDPAFNYYMIGNTEADARAKMLIYFIEQGVVKV